MHPLSNILFQRDPLVSLGNMVNVSIMTNFICCNETIISDFVFRKHPRFKDSTVVVSPKSNSTTFKINHRGIEGGDILILNQKTLLIGLTERTTLNSVKTWSKKLFQLPGNTSEEIICLTMAKARWCIHLDTILTQVDKNKFLAYKPFLYHGNHIVFHYLYKDGTQKTQQTTLQTVLNATLKTNVTLIWTSGATANIVDQAREQWNSATNVFCLEPGLVISYNRNPLTNEALKKQVLKC